MDRQKQPADYKKGLTPKHWFWIRLSIAAVVILAVWTAIAGLYVELDKSIVMGLIKSAGYYSDFQPKLTDALMSPAIPFVILMVGTWGVKLFWLDGKINWKLILWTVLGIVGLIGISVLGQYLSLYMSLANVNSSFMTNLTGFLIATAPVLIPVIVWTVLSYKEISRIFRKS